MSSSFPRYPDLAWTGVGLAISGLGVWVALAGPEGRLPVHYGMSGQADRYGGREEIGALLIGLGLLAAIGAYGFGWFAARAAEASRASSLRVSQALIGSTMLAVAVMISATSLSRAESIATALPMALLSFTFLVVGAFLGRVGPNPVVGVRTPWSFKSRLAWERSNRLAGRLFFLIGLAGLGFAYVAPQPAGLIAMIAAVLVAAAASVVESWRVWRGDPERQPF